MGFRVLIWLLVLLAGCSVTEIAGRNIEDIKRQYFTEAAYEQIKDIPLEYGGVSGYAVVNFWSQAVAFLTGHGLGRTVIISESALADTAKVNSSNVDVWIVHEYIHHLDDIGRDGGEVWIDIEEFWAAYQAIAGTPQNGLLYFQVEKMQDNWWTDTFGVGEHSERIAYVGGLLIRQRSTPELERVYRKVLRKYEAQ